MAARRTLMRASGNGGTVSANVRAAAGLNAPKVIVVALGSVPAAVESVDIQIEPNGTFDEPAQSSDDTLLVQKSRGFQKGAKHNDVRHSRGAEPVGDFRERPGEDSHVPPGTIFRGTHAVID